MSQVKETVTLQSIYEGYAAKAKKDGKDAEVNISKRFDITFIEDFRGFKKGATASVSFVMRDYYVANKVAKAGKAKASDAPANEDTDDGLL